MTAGHTFVCYARENSDFVRALTVSLRERGVQMWLDADIPAGAPDWEDQITRSQHELEGGGAERERRREDD